MKIKSIVSKILLLLTFTFTLNIHSTESCSSFVLGDLDALIEAGKEVIKKGKKDPELAQSLRELVNKGLDMNNLTSKQMEVFALTRQLQGSDTKTWAQKKHLRAKPYQIELDAPNDSGILKVLAHVSFSDLTLNSKVMERLLGVTFVVEIDGSDERAKAFKAVTTYQSKGNDFGNTRARWVRKNEVINHHQKAFNSLTRNSHIRLFHAVISLDRDSKGTYLLPYTKETSNPLVQGQLSKTEEIYAKLDLEGIFEVARTGRTEIRLQQGFSRGGASRFK